MEENMVRPLKWNMQLLPAALAVIFALGGFSGVARSQVYPSLALDNDDHPHVAFRHGYTLRYAVYDGVRWTTEDVVTVDTTRRIYYPSLALDSGEHPHISYADYLSANDTSLAYAYHNGSDWSFTVVDPGPGSYGEYSTSIAIDGSDYPHIAYHHHRYGYAGKYAYFNGTSWQKEIFDSGAGYFSTLAFDPAGRACVSYFDASPDLAFARRNGTNSWSLMKVDTTPSEFYGSTCLAFDPVSGLPRIAAYNRSTENLRYSVYDGSQWTTTTVQPVLPRTGALRGRTPFALDSEGHPHLVYFDNNTATVTYASYDGIEWSREVLSTTSGGYCAIILTGGDAPIVAFYDTEDRDLKVLLYQDPGWKVTTPYAIQIARRETQDTDGNGRIDRIRMKANKNLNDDFSGLSVNVAGYTSVGFDTGSPGDAEFFILLDEGAEYDTAALPEVQITANTSLGDAEGFEVQVADESPVAATDAAPPAIVSVSLVGTTFEAQVSEPVTQLLRRSDLGSGDWVAVSPAPSGSVVQDTNATAGRLFYTVAP
jgi:hypothetical protein